MCLGNVQFCDVQNGLTCLTTGQRRPADGRWERGEQRFSTSTPLRPRGSRHMLLRSAMTPEDADFIALLLLLMLLFKHSYHKSKYMGLWRNVRTPFNLEAFPEEQSKFIFRF